MCLSFTVTAAGVPPVKQDFTADGDFGTLLQRGTTAGADCLWQRAHSEDGNTWYRVVSLLVRGNADSSKLCFVPKAYYEFKSAG